MALKRRLRFVYYTLAAILCTFLYNTLFGPFQLEVAYVYGLAAFLFVTLVTQPDYILPRWRNRLNILVILGLAIFVSILVRRAIAVILL